MKVLEQIKDKAILVCCGFTLIVLILCPLAFVLGKAVIQDGCLDLSYACKTIAQSENVITIRNSILLGLAVVILSTIFAAPIAFLLSRTELKKHRWLDIVFMIPFMTPPYISSMGWILFMQKNGLLEQLLPGSKNLNQAFFSFFGLVLVMSLHVFPFMITILRNAFMNISSNLEEAGASLGAGFWYRIRKIIIPLLSSNFVIGALLVFVKTISEYGTPATLGQRIGLYVFTTDIHRSCTTSPINFSKAASLSVVLISICLMFWYGQNYITTKKSYRLISGKGVKVTLLKLHGVSKLCSYSYLTFLLVLSIGVPYFSVISTSLIKLRGYGLKAGNFTFSHYVELFTANDKGIRAVTMSFLLAVSAATISVVLGTIITTIIRHTNRKVKKTMEAISLLPEMLPGIVLVIGLMLFWNKIYNYLPLYNTVGFMILAYVVLYLPFTISYVNNAYTQMNDSLVQAGKVFGGTQRYIFFHITLPLIRKGMITAWIMTFIISFRELVAASMIAPPNVLTVSTFIVREFEQGSVSVGMAMAVICMLLTTTILIILQFFRQRKAKEGL